MDLIDVYRIFLPTTAKYTFLAGAHGMFSKIDHILGHKSSFNKYEKTEITPYIFSDNNVIKLELNNKYSSRKYTNNWRLNNTLLNDQWVIEEIREEIKNFLHLMKMTTQPIRTYGGTAKAVLRGNSIDMSAYTKNRKISNK
jgi:hypothetical protein